jgi:hypothetical protein
MNAARLLSLILSVTMSALPVTAQEPGPLARAAAREAVKLAAAWQSAPGSLETDQQGTPALSDWRRVRQLAPRAEISVIVRGTPPARRYFVAGDESELIVSNGAGQVEHIARTDVAEISVLAKHIGRHARRGLLVGGILGAVFMGAVLAEGGCSPVAECVAFTMVGAAGGAGYGALFGAIVGSVAPRSPDVIYRAP